MAIYLPGITLGVTVAAAAYISHKQPKDGSASFGGLSCITKRNGSLLHNNISEMRDKKSIYVLGISIIAALGATVFVALTTHNAFYTTYAFVVGVGVALTTPYLLT